MIIPSININEYNYLLPQERIAQYPREHRDMSKLLIYKKGKISHNEFFRLPDYISYDTALVFNNSRVICARLLFTKETGANIEIFCLEPYEPVEYQQNLQSTSHVSWKCLIGNKKRWKQGILEQDVLLNNQGIQLTAAYLKDNENDSIITFSWNDSNITFAEILENAGKIPVPPYLLRDSEEIDKYRYQTIYSKIKGSVAAPTAGLHFTPRIFEQLEIKGVEYKELTLHIGAGTFKPVHSDDISQHHMHEETFSVKLDQIDFLKENIGKIIAVGTTSTRLLESIYFMGVKCKKGEEGGFSSIGQWDLYKEDKPIPVGEALDALKTHFVKNNLSEITAKTSVMIVPGYRFKMIKGMITNFHQPKSTLLLLIAALIGDDWKRVYQYALDKDFRFLSYGDGSLLMP